MIRKLLLPALAAGLLAGCMSYGYDYRGGGSDYYYGQPSSDYRYYGSGSGYGYGGPYGSIGYGYPGGLNGSIGYGYPGGLNGNIGYGSRYGHSRYGYYPRGYYGSPYGHYNGYGYGYPYDPYYYYRRPIVVHRHPDGSTQPRRGERPDNDSIPQWRDPDEITRRRSREPEPAPRNVEPRWPSPSTVEVSHRPSRGEMVRERRLEAPERDERREQTP